MAFYDQFTQRRRYNQPASFGRDTTYSSGDYHAHMSNLGRVNTALEDVPRYPGGYMAFRNDNGSSQEDEDGIIHIEHHHHHVPEAPARHHRARFMEPRDEEKKLKEKGGIIRSVDDAADGFIKSKHRNFELRQWKTFKN